MYQVDLLLRGAARSLVAILCALAGAALLAACGMSAAPAPTSTPPPDPTTLPVGQAELGQAIFRAEVPIEGFVACQTCHYVDPTQGDAVGPNLAGVSLRAAGRIPGTPADEYLRRSILAHDEFVVEGFAPGLVRAILGGDFGELLTEEQVSHLVAYLNTLEGDLVAVAAAATHTAAPTATASRTAAPPSATPTLASPTSTAMPANTTSTSPPTETSPPTPTRLPTNSPAAASVSPTATLELPSATPVPPSATSAPPTAEPPTAVPTPTLEPPSATPEPPSATPAPPPPTAEPTLPSMPDEPGLAAYEGCISCHNTHPNSVQMPHPVNPTCNDCHRGSPNRIGCPSCHSMHTVEEVHVNDPNLPCTTCHQ